MSSPELIATEAVNKSKYDVDLARAKGLPEVQIGRLKFTTKTLLNEYADPQPANLRQQVFDFAKEEKDPPLSKLRPPTNP